jgi:Domain of unknown function (DUF4276)
MVKLMVVCEGATEGRFVSGVLAKHLWGYGVHVEPAQPFRNDYSKIRRAVINFLKQPSNDYVTTMIDFYGLSTSFPGYEKQSNPAFFYQKVERAEAAFKADVDCEGFDTHRFLPYLQLHKFEALLFSDPIILAEALALYETGVDSAALQDIRNSFDSPEHINDSPHTAPSKRILKLVHSYDKVTDGKLVAEQIGLSVIRQECRHFDQRLTLLEQLGI